MDYYILNGEIWNKEKKHHMKEEPLSQESSAPKEATKIPITLQETVLGFMVLDNLFISNSER